MAVGNDNTSGRIDDSADDADQGRLSGAIRSQQREYLSGPDLQVDFFEGLEARA
jgi:hypothetical protein